MMLFLCISVLVVVADYFTKLLAVNVFKTNEITLIKDVLYFTYVENRGAAFGILQNHRWVFIAITTIVIALIIAYVFIKKPRKKIELISLSLICGGGIGNMIDRISLSYVIDFIDFRIINFPVFNVADCAVVIGCWLLILYLLFIEGKENG